MIRGGTSRIYCHVFQHHVFTEDPNEKLCKNNILLGFLLESKLLRFSIEKNKNKAKEQKILVLILEKPIRKDRKILDFY